MTEQRTVHLVCNAHLDPIWLWEWQEGAAEAMSTFRTAADLCEEFPGFIFNHNEAVLYEWIEEYEPELFERIRRLVKAGQWNVMGGWYLQPDCNMPSGESFVRQMLIGRTYFRDRLGVDVTTAINFDPFGHSRGIAQVLARGGYDSYLFCRPSDDWRPLPDDRFVWIGFDGSEILCRRGGVYLSRLGGAADKVREYLASDDNLVLWGVGNHGGGPSRQDLRDLTELIADTDAADVIHSTPQAYFADLARRRDELPRWDDDLNPWAIGCYTSQVRIKQKHRELENELYSAERMLAAAASAKLLAYPRAELREAAKDLAFCEFHDILPGSSIQPAEEAAVRRMDRALEGLSRLKARAFFALSSGQPRAGEGDIPVLVYNPHPFKVTADVEVEFNLADQNWSGTFARPEVRRGRTVIPSQVEEELSNLNMDWRKRVVFRTTLEPSQMNRFDCRIEYVRPPRRRKTSRRGGSIRFRGERVQAAVNTRTGLLDRCRIDGRDVLAGEACRPIILEDTADAWGMSVRRFDGAETPMKLMTREEAAAFAGVDADEIDPVRIVEDGDVRMVVEALLERDNSRAVLRYSLPKRGRDVGVDVRVYWMECDRLLKLSLPLPDGEWRHVGQTAYGVQELPADGDEAVSQKWQAAVCDDKDLAVTLIRDGGYGSDLRGGALRPTLVRSPAYSGHPIGDRPIVPQDRHTPRIDQGERRFRFILCGGPIRERLDAIDREAVAWHETPPALSFFPSGLGERSEPFMTVSGDVVQVPAVKFAETGNDLIVRLFEPTGRARNATVDLPWANVKHKVRLGGFEVRTLRIDPGDGIVIETDLLEHPLKEG